MRTLNSADFQVLSVNAPFMVVHAETAVGEAGVVDLDGLFQFVEFELLGRVVEAGPHGCEDAAQQIEVAGIDTAK